MDGRKVEWEVWGRRSPYLFWARVGDQIRVDNGRERLEVTAADDGGRSGVVMRTRSRLGLDDWTINPNNLFVAGPVEPQPEKEGWRTTTFVTHLPEETLQVRRVVQFVVDRSARLPVHYRVQSDGEGEPAESLTLDYGSELPQSVTQPRWPEGYQLLDLLRNEPGQTATAPGVDSAGGFSVQATPLTVDRAGNILVRVRGWLDTMPLDARAPFLLWVSGGEAAESAAVASDELGRKYRYVPLEWLRLQQHLRLNGDRLMIFAPERPLAGKSPLPHRLILTLNVAAAPHSPRTGASGFDSVSVQENFNWNLALPGRPAPIRPEQWLGTDWQEAVGSTGTPLESVESAIARSRAVPAPMQEQ
jgi:hypothetical protein